MLDAGCWMLDANSQFRAWRLMEENKDTPSASPRLSGNKFYFTLLVPTASGKSQGRNAEFN